MTTRAATESIGPSGEGDFCRAVRAAARGDQAAFKQLYDRYARSVYNLVYRCMRNADTSEDVCQEVWVKAFRELHRLEEPQAFPAWLYRIAARACVDAARRSSRAPATAELLEERASSASEEPERSALQRERVRLTWEALAVIPARQHLALFLREMERRSYKEIAQMLETSESAVETLLFRARHAFAKAYDRLEATMNDRCHHAQRAMAAIMDGEATPVQQTAVRAHVDACRSCSGEMARMQRAAAALAALAPLPVPVLLGERIFGSLGGAGAHAAPAGFGKMLALAGVKAKVAAITLVATGTITAAAVASPIGDEIVPGMGGERSAPQGAFETGASGDADASAGADAGAQPTAPALPGLLPDATGIVDGLTSSTLTTLNETAAELTGTVDSLVHEAQATADETLPPAPQVPLPTPTVPALPPLP